MVTTTDEHGPRYLLVEAPPGAGVDELHARLDRGPAPGGPGPPLPLRHGYAVNGRGEQSPSTCPVRLVVVAGPDAGGSVPVRPGRWVTVGRGTSCDLTVLDPALSREHLRVRHERSGIVVQDLGSTNGLRWDVDARSGDERPRNATPAQEEGRELGQRDGRRACMGWPPGSTLVLGVTRLAIVLEPSPPAAVREHAGRLLVTPWPRQLPEHMPLRLSSPARPRRREVRAPSAWVWALPLVASVVIALVLRMPMVLLFGLMAPTMVVGHHLGERRAARLDQHAAQHQHSEELEELALLTARAVSEELAVLRARHPGVLGVVTALLPCPTTRLWSHGGEPPTVVLGEGRLTADVELDGVALDHAAGPVVLDLSQPVAVIGPPGLRAGVVRSWLLQLACAHPPSELTLVVDPAAPPGAAWDLLAWLPHTRPAPGPQTPVRIRWGHPDGLLLLDDVRDAPAGVVQVVLDGASGAVLRRPGRTEVPFRPTMLGLPLARCLARTLAPFDHEDPTSGGGPRPRTLGDLMSWPTDEDEVRTSWATGTDLLVPIGTDDAGAPVTVDLARDGPHALIAGTTGSGKSELLRTLVTALALRNPPSSLCFLLIDYKGGSSLAECAALPHATGLVTDLDPHLAERVLVSLRAELRRREAVLAEAGARDVRDLDGAGLPRLLVVIDEFRVLAEELPDLMSGLVRLAAVGRSLGVHLVLATQRPAGVVSADLRANVNLRIALRVRDAADSLDVLETPEAAALPEGQPGRALLRTGPAPVRPVRVVPAAPAVPATRRPGWRIEEVEGVWSGWARVRAPDAARAVDSRLDALPALLGRVAEQDGHVTPRVWQPPLEGAITMDAPGCWALADRPETQSHEPVTWTASSHIGVVGAARSGRSTTVRSLVGAAGPVWLYVIDPARGLEGTELSSHPGLRAWVGPHDPAHAMRVLEVVTEVVDARLARGAGPGEVPVLMVVDGWDRFVDAYGDTGQGRARDLALRVLRDGSAAGVVTLMTGDRSLLTGAVASALPETWALRLHDPGDLALAGLRPHQVPSDQPPGRAVRTRDGLVAQVLLPAGGSRAPATPSGTPPPRVVSLPASPRDQDAWAVGGDDATGLPVAAAPFLVLGPPGSGVTATLSVLAARQGGPVVRLDASALDADPLAGRLARFAGTVVVDDAHLLAGGGVEEVVLAWAGRSGGRLVVGAELEAASTLFRGLVPQVARHRRGLVLQPSSAAHGTLLGVRLPVGDRLVPGRGVLVDRGRCTRVQVCGLSPPRAPG